MVARSTGYGQHGDYMFGWKDDALQRAINGNCFGANCQELETQSFDEANKCAVQNVVDEPVDGCKSRWQHQTCHRSGLVKLTDTSFRAGRTSWYQHGDYVISSCRSSSYYSALKYSHSPRL